MNVLARGAITLTAALLCACPAPTPVPSSPPSGGAVVGVAYAHAISTHCGIVATQFDGREWVADPPLSDGQGNPPAGWDNPTQGGVMVLLDRDHAEFRAPTGRTARFRVRVAGDPPVPACD